MTHRANAAKLGLRARKHTVRDPILFITSNPVANVDIDDDPGGLDGFTEGLLVPHDEEIMTPMGRWVLRYQGECVAWYDPASGQGYVEEDEDA